MRPVLSTMRAAILEAWANRSGFWTQVLAMVVNDIVWVIFWVLFFDRVGAVRGWDRDGVLLILAVLTTGAGLVLGLLSNARSIGRMAANGELDAVLALPVPPLAHLIVRRVNTANLGDFAFGLVLFTVAGRPTLDRVAIYLAGTAAAAVLLTGFVILMGSLTFFGGRSDVAELSLNSLIMFASYPVDVFGGAAKVVLYTVIPAAFIGAVPARLVGRFDPVVAAAAIGVAAAFALAGWAAFTLGLRRYTSGAVWTRA